MFKKHKVAFTNKTIFGHMFKNNIEDCFCKLSKMLFSGKIESDGTIDPSKSDAFSASELWSYVYYLYYYNKSDIDEFAAMKSKKTGRASAAQFYELVKSVTDGAAYSLASSPSPQPINKAGLISFLNSMIRQYGEDLVNPVFDYLRVLIEKPHLMNLKGIKLVTGKSGEANVQFVTDPKQVEKANIKVSLIQNAR